MKTWSMVATLVLVVVCGMNIVATTARVRPQPRAPAAIPTDIVMRHELRMAGVRDALRQRGVRGTVGYLADVPAAELPGNHQRMEQYFLTQFALVPSVLDANVDACSWVVANLHTTTIAERAPADFRLVRDFGHGVALLERVRP